MRLEFIALDKLAIARTNMRHGRKSPDVSDLLPTVRKRGILQTLLVRPNCAPGQYEIVAGRRRYHAARIVAEERRAAAGEPDATGSPPEPEPLDLLPCAILDEGDDADAVEASLIENLARLDADEVTQWETFTRLVREGRSVEDIGLTFGLPDLTVRRILALGNLLPRIRSLYAADQIDRVTVRHLTLASKSQQKAWLALVDDAETRAPTGQQLKAWLLGGTSIPVKHALFDVEASGLAVVTDLFGEDRWFADPEAFWTAQNAEIEARRAAFVEAGWSDAVVVPPAQHFAAWEHEKAAKRKGGRVYIDVRGTGEVVVHEGYVTRKEAARAASGPDASGEGEGAKLARPEVSGPMQTYIDLHRHAAVRAALLDQPGTALRMMVAHAIAGSHLWSVHAEPQSARSDAVAESVETCRGETVFDERRRSVLAQLGFAADTPCVVEGRPEIADGPRGDTLARIFWRLLALPDAAVLDVVALVMGESLAAGSVAVDALGLHLGVDMAEWWSADPAFFELIRDREVMTSLVSEVAGETVAAANAKEKTSTMKALVADHLEGTNGRTKVERWVPRWMAFPPGAYTARGGVGTVRAHGLALAAREPVAPDNKDAGGDEDA
jgi:ParB family chromosome partitioning protein